MYFIKKIVYIRGSKHFTEWQTLLKLNHYLDVSEYSGGVPSEKRINTNHMSVGLTHNLILINFYS